MAMDTVLEAVRGADALTPPVDAVIGRMLGARKRRTAVARCNGVAASKHLLAEAGVIAAKAF